MLFIKIVGWVTTIVICLFIAGLVYVRWRDKEKKEKGMSIGKQLKAIKCWCLGFSFFMLVLVCGLSGAILKSGGGWQLKANNAESKIAILMQNEERFERKFEEEFKKVRLEREKDKEFYDKKVGALDSKLRKAQKESYSYQLQIDLLNKQLDLLNKQLDILTKRDDKHYHLWNGTTTGPPQ
jgi:hypothetical protein